MKILIYILNFCLLLGSHTISDGPTSIFLEFVKELESMNWTQDHERLTKVSIYPEIDRESKVQFDGLNFYPINYEQSRVNKIDVSRAVNNERAKEGLSQVESIWAYFYRKDPQEQSNPDGLIEQWKFENEEEAMKALKDLDEIAQMIYFNTRPYYFVHENFIYIFHSRAMAYSFEQKPVFEKFKSKFE